MRRLHVAFVTDATSFAGAEIALHHLVTELSEDIAVTVVATHEPVAARIAADRAGARIALVPEVLRQGRPSRAELSAHRWVLRAVGPDVVQLNLREPSACRTTLLAAASLPGIPVVAVTHLPLPVASLQGRLAARVLARAVDVHIAVGHASAREVESQCGLAAGSVRVVHNGIPPAPGRPLRPARARHVVGTLARFDPQKSLDVLVRAVAPFPDVDLLLAGDGPDRHALAALARDLGIADRVVVGHWADDARAVLDQLDVFALPSRHEAFPLAVLEAMAAGVPVVATDVGSVRDAVVDGRTGLLVRAGDVEDLGRCLRRLLDDRALADQLSAAAAQTVKTRFTAAAMARAFEQVYADLTCRSAPGLRSGTAPV